MVIKKEKQLHLKTYIRCIVPTCHNFLLLLFLYLLAHCNSPAQSRAAEKTTADRDVIEKDDRAEATRILINIDSEKY